MAAGAMANPRPNILMVNSNRDARQVAALRDAGFAVVVSAEARGAMAALRRERFAALIVALPAGEGDGLLRQARRHQSDLKALVVGEGAVMPGEAAVAAGCEPRELVGRVIDLLVEDVAEFDAASRRHKQRAELGLVAAKLACLYQRHASAAAAGAGRLAFDLARQIGELHRRHAGDAVKGGDAVNGGDAAPALAVAD